MCRELEQLRELNRRLTSSTAEGPAANGIHTTANDAAAAEQAMGTARDAAQKAEARAQAETQATAYQKEARALQGLSMSMPCPDASRC